MLDIITAHPLHHDELHERLARWGQESVPRDPREFDLRGIGLVQHPVPHHVQSQLPGGLGANAIALSLDESVLLEWLAGRLSRVREVALRRLFAILPVNGWAIAYEASSGAGVEVLRVPADKIFASLDAIIRESTRYDLILVVPG